MATISTTLRLFDQMSQPIKNITNAMNIMISSFEQAEMTSANAVDTSSLKAAREQINQASASIKQMDEYINQASDEQQTFNTRLNTGSQNASKLLTVLGGLFSIYAVVKSINAMIDVSDTLTSDNARLALINDGLQTQAELQEKIYQAAQRSRSSYTEMVSTVAKLNLLAADAFSSNDEAITFVELMNKAFKVSGASATESTNAMYQLTQAMASNRLQGDEFRSILENAPMLAQAIADELGITQGELKTLASEGEITADVIKNALFDAADDIESKFETLPKTFADVWTEIKNYAVKKFQSVSDQLSNTLNSERGLAAVQSVKNAIATLLTVLGAVITIIMNIAGYSQDNWSWIAPIIWSIVGAFIAYNVVLGIHNGLLALTNTVKAIAAVRAAAHGVAVTGETAATVGMTAAQLSFNAALYACPITWIIAAIVAIIVLIYVIVGVINKLTGSTVSATGIIVGAIVTAGAVVGNVFISLINFLISLFVLLYNIMADVANFFGNVFNDPVGAICRLFFDMVDWILELLQDLANAIDDIFGSNLSDSVQGWRDNLSSWVDDKFGEEVVYAAKLNAEDYEMDRISYTDAWNYGYSLGESFEDTLSDLFSADDLSDISSLLDDIYSTTSSTADSTADTADSLDASEEDLQYLRDLAEQEVINRFTTAEITVNLGGVTNNVSENTDLDGVVSYLEETLEETMAVVAEGV